jgi:hypothetical protein
MPSLVERCACGAKIELTEVHYTQIVSYVRFWRAEHKCVSQPEAEPEVNIISVDASRNELPMGFSRGMRSDTGDPEPIDDDPEERRRR